MNDPRSKEASNNAPRASEAIGRDSWLPRILQTLLGHHMSEVVEGAGVALAVRVLGTLLGFVFHLLLARRLGSQGAGLFFLAVACLTAFGILGRLGLDVIFLRFTAAAVAIDDRAGIRATHRRVILLVVATATFASLLFFKLADPLAEWVFAEKALGPLLRWMALAVLPACLYRIYAEGLRGLRKIFYYQALVGAMVPLISIPVLLATLPIGGVTAPIWARIAAATLTALLGAFLWYRYAPRVTPGERGLGPTYSELLTSSLPLAGFASSLFISNRIPLVILGIWWTAQDAGVLGISTRVATLIAFGLGAVNAIVAPKFAALHRQGRHRELAETARRSTWLLFLLALPILGTLIVFSGPILALFGEDFEGYGTVLAILAIGQLINVATGPAGYLLMMTGHEVDTGRVAMGTAILSVVLALLVIPKAGVLGAAAVSASVLAIRNLSFVVLVQKRLGVSLLGPLPRPTSGDADHNPLE